MKHTFIHKAILVWVITAMLPLSRVYAQYEPKTVDEMEIITTFANYKIGFETFNAALIMKNLSRASVAYFDTLLQDILYADSLTLMSLPVSKMVYVLDARKKARAKVALAKNGTELLNILLNYGIVREDLDRQITAIHFKDSMAYCAATTPTSTQAKDYIFIMEDEFWKINLHSQFSEADENFSSLLKDEETMKKYNLTKDYLYRAIFDKLGIPQGSSEVWKPIAQKP